MGKVPSTVITVVVPSTSMWMMFLLCPGSSLKHTHMHTLVCYKSCRYPYLWNLSLRRHMQCLKEGHIHDLGVGLNLPSGSIQTCTVPITHIWTCIIHITHIWTCIIHITHIQACTIHIIHTFRHVSFTYYNIHRI